MTPASELPSVAPKDDLTVALDRFGPDAPLLPVVEDGTLAGLLFRESVGGYVRMREMLGVDDRH
jgi:hypothetical protein